MENMKNANYYFVVSHYVHGKVFSFTFDGQKKAEKKMKTLEKNGSISHYLFIVYGNVYTQLTF